MRAGRIQAVGAEIAGAVVLLVALALLALAGWKAIEGDWNTALVIAVGVVPLVGVALFFGLSYLVQIAERFEKGREREAR